MANGRADDPDNEPTRYGGFGEPTQAASYGGNTGGQAYSEYQAGADYTDYGAATEYAGQAPPPEPPTPWFRKPGALVAIGAVAALVLAAAIYAIVPKCVISSFKRYFLNIYCVQNSGMVIQGKTKTAMKRNYDSLRKQAGGKGEGMKGGGTAPLNSRDNNGEKDRKFWEYSKVP